LRQSLKQRSDGSGGQFASPPTRVRTSGDAHTVLSAAAQSAAKLFKADTEVVYKVDDYYAPECEHCIAYHDPTPLITGPINPAEAILSERDRKLPAFADFVAPLPYNGV
jgi:dTDP-4-dehydrorhamnose 3,5-epimerase